MDKQQMLMLIESAKGLNWTSQDTLRQFENEYINNKEVLVITSDMMQGIKRYLALGSLPYVFIKDEDPVTAQRIAQMKINVLWTWLFSFTPENVDPFIWRPTVPTGNVYPKYMVIGDAPGQGKSVPLPRYQFDRTLCYGPSSHTLRKALLSINVLHKCWFTNLCKLSIRDNRPTLSSEVILHQKHLFDEMRILKPDTVILLGRHVTNMFEEYFMPFGQPMKDVKRVISVHHPAYIHRTGINPEAYGNMIKEKLENE